MSAAAVPVQIQPPEWSPSRRIAFRWAFLFLAMLLIPELIWIFDADGRVLGPIDRFWRTLVLWTSRNVFHIAREIRNFSTGDSAYANLRLLDQALLAAIGTGIWSALRPGAREYTVLYYWLRVATRFVLANLLLSYGVAKLFHVQFPYPPLTTLIQSFGQLTPHQLHWSFMGFSRPYQVFAGVLECGAALLLFWNRTTTLGTLISSAALVNILFLDWAYGTAVKLIVVRMLLFAGFLLLQDAHRLACVILWNRPTAPLQQTVPWRLWRAKWAVYAAKAAIVAWILFSHARWGTRMHPIVDHPGHPPLYGIYRVQLHSVDGKEIASDDAARWNLAAFDNVDRELSSMVVRSAAESWRFYAVTYDEANSRMTLGPNAEALRITRPGPDTVRLDGSLDKKPIAVSLRRLPLPEFPLEKNARRYWIARW